MCFTPVTVKRDREDWMDDVAGTHNRIVPCGKCPECLHRRSEAWAFRLYQEMKISSSAKFITLTYDENNVPYIVDKETGELTRTLNKSDFQKFMKKFRKLNFNKLKYYTCGEYGDQTDRPHYHSVLFNMDTRAEKKLQETWKKGQIKVDPVNMARIRYVTKYITKRSYFKPSLNKEPEFALMSKGMGKSYLTERMINYYIKNQIGVITNKGGVLQPLPRYYKEQIFSKAERYKIAEEGKELAEIKHNEKFKTSQEHITWVKDQYRKIQKQESLKRNQI